MIFNNNVASTKLNEAKNTNNKSKLEQKAKLLLNAKTFWSLLATNSVVRLHCRLVYNLSVPCHLMAYVSCLPMFPEASAVLSQLIKIMVSAHIKTHVVKNSGIFC